MNVTLKSTKNKLKNNEKTISQKEKEIDTLVEQARKTTEKIEKLEADAKSNFDLTILKKINVNLKN